jgi:FKBP-type peptidyl-prolyl cis-trans isomerase SlyD
MNISEKKIVTVSYDLFVQTEKESPELMESATAEQPLVFCFGIDMMLKAFEDNLLDKKNGDEFDFTIASDDAYGQYNEDHVVDLPKNIFEVEGKFDDEMVAIGKIVPLMDAQGNKLNAEVLAINETEVSVDLNHPLAGENLNFKGKVIDVHEASEEELTAYLGGGGCGCDSEGCGTVCDTDDCNTDGCGCN